MSTADLAKRRRRITLGVVLGALIAAFVAGLEVSAERRWISGTGALALVLLLASLACSPLATALASKRPPMAVALRGARRSLGLLALLAATVHATLGAYGYLGRIDLEAIATVPWLRHGALALLVLGALGLTSFSRVARALHVRAWSALHRLVYVAVILVGLHALAAPFGDLGAGLVALIAATVLLALRIVLALVAARRRPSSEGRNAS